LGREAEAVGVYVAGGLVDAAFEGVLGFEGWGLGGDQAQDDQLVGGDEAEGLEGAGAVVVVFEEEAVDLEAGEDRLGDEVVAA
jgi:hypothetical protein